MATTNQTYSLIPTSTHTSGFPTATNVSNNGGGTFSDLLSSPGSPPLIMTFLSIGLFVIAMTGVFGWRRLSRLRGRELQPVVGPNHRHKPILPYKRPVLWDVWADLQIREKSATRVMGWENITPMTAILTFLVPPVRPLVEPLMPIKSVGRVLFGIVRHLVSDVKRFYLPHPPPPPPEPDKNEAIPLTSLTSDAIEWGDASSLYVSVIIAMPAQRRCGSGTSEDVDPELGEFCIGTMDVPWSNGE